MRKTGKTGRNFIIYLMAVSCLYACNKRHATSLTDSQVIVSFKHTLPSLLHESSGLCYTNGNLWTFGDSGNPNAVYKIDTTTGAILQTVTVQNFPNEDWEDIAADEDYIYIGDFGNNNGTRKDLKILRIRKSDISTASIVNINAEAISFSYTDQEDFTENKNNNFNCEALVAIENNLYIFSKDEGDFQTRSYELPKEPGSYSATPISSFNVEGEITSAAYNPATKELALGGYESQKLHPFIWFFKDFADNHFFEGAKTKVSLSGNDTLWQTEGMDYSSSSQIFLSCESTPDINASLFTASLYLHY